ncbi:hypothetical protein ACGFZ7_16485 [Pseudomonas sp. NPDC047963]|nr:hypothetical protein [Pseudomonas sp.]
MVKFRLAGPYAPPAPLAFTLQARYIDVIYVDPPRLRRETGGTWSSSRRGDVSTGAMFGSPPPVEQTVALSHQQGAPQDHAPADGWGQSTVTDRRVADTWQHAEPIAAAAVADGWQSNVPCDRFNLPAWSVPATKDAVRLQLSWQIPALKDGGPRVRHRDADRYGKPWRYEEALPPYMPGSQPLVFRFAGVPYFPARTPEVYFALGRDLRGHPTQRKDTGVAVGYGRSRPMDLFRRLRWGWGRAMDPIPTGVKYPDYQGPVIIIEPPTEPDILETYMIANSVSLVVLPDRTPLDATSLQVGRDIDAFSWTLTANLFGVTSLNLVRPDSNGPKTVELTINGHVWLFLVERYSGQGKFPSERYTINGVSRSQLLAEPYAPKRSAVNAVAISARQAAEDQLLNTGFTLEWDSLNQSPPDWTIPASALTYQDQAAMQVIARIAEAVGAVVSPALAGDSISVVPRYREAVWWWSTAIMDRIIPAEIVGEWGSEWTPQPSWNSCYVSGTTHGVSVDVRRAGTAGDQPAPDVYDDLITATDAARHRGIAELCKSGNQEIVTRTMPLFPASTAPGLVEPAMLCEVREPGGGSWRGLCLSTEISAEGTGASRVKQTIKLERHH